MKLIKSFDLKISYQIRFKKNFCLKLTHKRSLCMNSVCLRIVFKWSINFIIKLYEDSWFISSRFKDEVGQISNFQCLKVVPFFPYLSLFFLYKRKGIDVIVASTLLLFKLGFFWKRWIRSWLSFVSAPFLNLLTRSSFRQKLFLTRNEKLTKTD